ncbi:response regulator, partial [Thiocystis violacea]|uniref:response regulator n=1 Tax=Thiocystis violacea TaxID=13725 RepID=UPI0019048746
MESLNRNPPSADEPILIVDDDPSAIDTLRRILRRGRYSNLLGATDPRTVSELLERHQPSLVVLDLHMPGMDGFEVLERMRGLYPPQEGPAVLVVTASDDRATRLRALESGAMDYLVKPYDPYEVMLRVRNLLEIQKRGRLLSGFLNSTPVAMFAQDGDGRCTYINNAAMELLGYANASAFVGQDIHALIHHTQMDGSPHEADACPILAAAVQGRPVHRDDDICWRADGTSVPVEYWAYPLTGNGTRGGALVTFLDIGKRLESEHRLRLASTVFESVDRALVVTDRDANIVAVNRAYTRLTGWSQDEVLGRNPRFRQSGRQGPAFYQAMWRTLLDKGTWEGELWNLRKDGDSYLEELTITTVRDGHGEITNYVASARDLTKARRRAQELELARNRADAASEAKTRFVANMSHEIRTPLTAIVGFAESLTDEGQSAPERVRAVEAIIRNGRYLRELVDNILDFSKIEADRLDLERMETPLAELLREIAALGGARARGKGLDFQVIVEPPWPRTLMTDPTRAKQILVNLVNNAIKFTERGSVLLRVSLDRERERLVCAVADTGIGIEEQRLPELFESFVQADASTARHHGGSGLGLTIARGLARRLGGDLRARSVLGIGSQFTATLATGPLPDTLLEPVPPDLEGQAIAMEQAEATSVPSLSGQVLLADDHSDNRELISLYLERAGARVSAAKNGQEAVDLAQQQPFDLVLMDMQMPVLDGLDATRLLRLTGFEGPIVALTANATEADRKAALAAGCDDFLTKPIQLDRFHATLGRYLKTVRVEADRPAERVAAPMRDTARYRELRATFLAELPGQLEAMGRALERQEYGDLATIAHKL